VEVNLRVTLCASSQQFFFSWSKTVSARAQLDDRQMESELFRRVVDTFKHRSKDFR